VSEAVTNLRRNQILLLGSIPSRFLLSDLFLISLFKLLIMQTIFYGLIICYWLMMPILIISWYRIHIKDPAMSLSERRWSLLVFAIATLLWPVVLPLTYVELLSKVKRYELEKGSAAAVPCPMCRLPVWDELSRAGL
jgi:polyferredoxin